MQQNQTQEKFLMKYFDIDLIFTQVEVFWIEMNRLFPVCVLQSEPFSGQGSLPSGGAGGYNAFTQAAVNGVSKVCAHIVPF